MRLHRMVKEVPPVLWLVAVAAIYLAPALSHGASLGPYDILGTSGLTAHAHASVHNLIGSDEIEEFIPWEVLSWTQVHGGHLPLWDPYSLLGMPLAFNFQSAPFSFSVLFSYLFPLHLAHSAAVAARLVVGGTGAYVLCRVLSLSPLSSALCGTVFELSGGFSIWLGSYEAGCYALLGWILAASIHLSRGRHRARDVALLAVGLALGLDAGEPQIALFVLAGIGIVAGVLTAGIVRRSGRAAGRRCLVDHVLAVVAGVCLAAPIYLPGLQLALGSARSTGPFVSGLPLYDLTHFLFSSYDGVPTAPFSIIGPDNLYVSMLYVGVVPVVLALVALRDLRRRVEVAAFAALGGILLIALFFRPVVDLARHLPEVDVFRVVLGTTVVDLAVAVLAGFGCEGLRSAREARQVGRWLGGAVGAVGVALGVLAIRLALNVDHLPPAEVHQRWASFVWPAAGLAGLLAVFGGRWFNDRSRGARSAPSGLAGPVTLGVLLVVTAGFLVDAGAGLWSSTSRPFPASPAVTGLERAVGSSLVGIGSCVKNAFPPVGLIPNVNLAYGVDELAGFDPIVPRAYSLSYGEATGTTTKVVVPPALFCPAITSVSLARRYGVSYILEPPGTAGPVGTRLVATLAGEGLDAVPGSSRATLSTLGGGRASTTIARLEATGPSSFRVAFDARRPSLLELRITDVPGWNATIDGRRLRLARFDEVMLEAKVPAGRHVVRLSYWPRTFTVGLVLAGLSALSLLGGCVVAAGVARRRRRAVD